MYIDPNHRVTLGELMRDDQRGTLQCDPYSSYLGHDTRMKYLCANKPTEYATPRSWYEATKMMPKDWGIHDGTTIHYHDAPDFSGFNIHTATEIAQIIHDNPFMAGVVYGTPPADKSLWNTAVDYLVCRGMLPTTEELDTHADEIDDAEQGHPYPEGE